MDFYLYKSLRWLEKVKNQVNRKYIRTHITEKQLIYHPLWVAKTLVIAERPPFPPKKIPRMIFVDAISGYRGLLSTFPETTNLSIKLVQLVDGRIKEEEAYKFIKDVQEKQINRSYVLKKPKHKIVDLTLIYLLLWKVNVTSDKISREFIINANTGESEDYMGSLWKENRWVKIS